MPLDFDVVLYGLRQDHEPFHPATSPPARVCQFETGVFISKLIEKLSEKRGDEPSVVANYIRSKISFELVRSQVACIRGARKMKKMTVDTGDMNLVNSCANIGEQSW